MLDTSAATMTTTAVATVLHASGRLSAIAVAMSSRPTQAHAEIATSATRGSRGLPDHADTPLPPCRSSVMPSPSPEGPLLHRVRTIGGRDGAAVALAATKVTH